MLCCYFRLQNTSDMKKSFYFFALCFALGYTAKCQQAIVSSGASYTNNSGSLSYSIGQAFYSDINEGNIRITEGVQQAYATTIDNVNIEEAQFELSVFPNPTRDYLHVHTDLVDVSNYSYCIYNKEGKIILSSDMKTSQTDIDLSQFSAATYFLQIRNKKQIEQTFTIIKSH